ncbi:stage II sporulation protein R [Paenibacillus sp. D9]|uniref:stage II sporulation protein R n=1 Tax=Paenibacillus sp. D9 TaxID=665792 RepID=UPI000A01509E|nr:stage II sporulation protein R [Paenibacillus sp. D9]
MSVHSYTSVSRPYPTAASRPYSAAAHSYRFPFRLSYLYLILCVAFLMMSWENVRNDAALAQSSIPSEAIRLRILANSDSAVDQATKRVVRDAVVQAMNGWAAGPQTIEEARAALRSHLGEIEAIVARTLQDRGFSYRYKAELGQVAFPTKVYGEQVYPAGDYEALLITLGEGKGQNWWCVLFPPLCFLDSSSGDAAPKAEAAAAVADSKPDQLSKADAGKASAVAADAPAEAGQAPEAKFFIWELIKSFFSFLRGLFA